MAQEGKERIAVIGGGSWGTAFAAMLAERHGEVSLWVREPDVCAAIRKERENRAFLPGVKVPLGVDPGRSLSGEHHRGDVDVARLAEVRSTRHHGNVMRPSHLSQR